MSAHNQHARANGEKGCAVLLALPAALLALSLTGCGTVIRVVSTPVVAVINAGFWASERLDCGLKCPKDSSCQPYHSGVFASDSRCTCTYGETKGGSRYPSKGDPCPPRVTP